MIEIGGIVTQRISDGGVSKREDSVLGEAFTLADASGDKLCGFTSCHALPSDCEVAHWLD